MDFKRSVWLFHIIKVGEEEAHSIASLKSSIGPHCSSGYEVSKQTDTSDGNVQTLEEVLRCRELNWPAGMVSLNGDYKVLKRPSKLDCPFILFE